MGLGWPPFGKDTLAGGGGHQLIQLGISGEPIGEGHQRGAVLNQAAACVCIGDVAHLRIGY